MARALIDNLTATDSGVGWYQVGGIVTASGARLHAGTLSKVRGDEDRKPSLGHELAHLIGYESRQCADVIACGSGMRRTGGTVQHPTWTHPCSDGVATLCRAPPRKRRAQCSTVRLLRRYRRGTLAPVSRAVLRAARVAEAGYTAGREDGGWSACCVAHPWRGARPAGADFPFLRPPASRSAINNPSARQSVHAQ